MLDQHIIEQFEQLIELLPQEIISKGKLERRNDCLGLNWSGGSLFYGDNRGTGEFVLHVFDIGGGREFNSHYPIDDQNLRQSNEDMDVLIEDFKKFASKLIS